MLWVFIFVFIIFLSFLFCNVSGLLACVWCAFPIQYVGLCNLWSPCCFYDVLMSLVVLWPQSLYLSRTNNQHGHGVCWMSTGRQNGLMWRTHTECIHMDVIIDDGILLYGMLLTNRSAQAALSTSNIVCTFQTTIILALRGTCLTRPGFMGAVGGVLVLYLRGGHRHHCRGHLRRITNHGDSLVPLLLRKAMGLCHASLAFTYIYTSYIYRGYAVCLLLVCSLFYDVHFAVV